MAYAKASLAFNSQSSIYLNSSYDISSRKSINITLISSNNNIDYFVDNTWWNSLTSDNKTTILNKLSVLTTEFDNTIKPILTNTYGLEPVLDFPNSSKLNIILTPMTGSAQGYIKLDDFISKQSNSNSNEGKNIFLNSNRLLTITDNILDSFLAHEYTHILAYNQKSVKSHLFDEKWLEELRAEYSPTLVGYDSRFKNSYLQSRIDNFVYNNKISFIPWEDNPANYSSVNLLAQYIVDQYGINILVDSLKINRTGIDSINYALNKNGFRETFNDVFQNWLIANIINDCSNNIRYCYKNPSLKNISIIPINFYIPTNGNSALSTSDSTANYMAKYQKINGGSNNLTLTFENPIQNTIKKIPYILIGVNGEKSAQFFNFTNDFKQTNIVKNFSKDYSGLIIIPFFVNDNPQAQELYIFKWDASTSNTIPDSSNPQNELSTIQKQTLIIKLQNQLINLLQQLVLLLIQQR